MEEALRPGFWGFTGIDRRSMLLMGGGESLVLGMYFLALNGRG